MKPQVLDVFQGFQYTSEDYVHSWGLQSFMNISKALCVIL